MWFVWLLCGITLLNLALLSRVTDPYAPITFSVRLLNPLVTIGAAWLIATTLHHHPPHYRWAWRTQVLALVFGAGLTLLQIEARMRHAPILTPALKYGFGAVYVLSFVSIALYLPRLAGWSVVKHG